MSGPRGVVEQAADGRLSGWAHDQTRPFRRLAVVASDGGGRSVRTVADIYRADLEQAGLGDGHAGFSLSLRSFAEPGMLTLVLEASGVPLEGSPVVPAASGTSEAGEVGSIAFGLDPIHLSGLRRTGWAIDRAAADRPLLLALRSGEATIAETRATRFRPERAAVGDDAFCGFAFDWAPDAAHPLRLYDARSGAYLARLT